MTLNHNIYRLRLGDKYIIFDDIKSYYTLPKVGDKYTIIDDINF